MRKHFLWLLIICALTTGRAWALKQPAGSPRAYGYIMWHEKYLLFAARVEDPLLVGTSTEPQVFPANDDGIELCFSMKGPDGRQTASRLAISAAGGFAAFTRDQNGRWRIDNSWLQPPSILKFAVGLDGTLNNPADVDRAYTVEVALPWERLGGKPEPATVMGFNYLVRVRGENQAAVSWSPTVATEEDNETPAHWGAMLLFPGGRPSEAEQGALSCPKTYRIPFIDGKLIADEWIGASVISLTKPMPEFQPSPESGKARSEMPLLMALYRYDYAGGSPGEPPAPGAVPPAALTDQPRDGLGPWWSGVRPGWHREQLREAQRVGIDVLLPSYSPAPGTRADYGRRGLAALTEALKELREVGRSYPTVGMYLDTAGLARALGEPADLTGARGQQILYGAIREFYEHIPAEFRAEVGTKERKGYPVVLGPPVGLANWDGEFIRYADRAFARDFAGARLVWLADPGWKSRGVSGLEAYPPLAGLQRSGSDETGEAGVVVLSPGSSELGSSSRAPRSSARELREQYKRLLALNPAYLVLNSWNDYLRGSYIAPSRQEGLAFTDAFAAMVSQAAEKVQRPVVLKKVNFPATVAPGGKTTVELILDNSSAQEISTDDRVGFDWRIMDESGRLTVAKKNDVEALRIAPGGSARLLVPVSAVDSSGKFLRPGRYLLEFNLRRSSLPYLRSPLISHNLASLRLPLVVERPPDYTFTVLDSTLRSHLKSGAKYRVAVTLRNDGARTWKKQTARLSYRWYRVADDLEAADSRATELAAPGAPAGALPRDVAPGEVVTLFTEVEAGVGDGPLPVWSPGDLWHYGLGWRLEVNEESIAPAAESREAVYVVKEEVGSRFVDSTTPGEMNAGQEYQVQVVVSNVSTESWPAGEAYLVQHWLYWDGSAARWEAGEMPLPREVKPEESIQLTAAVKAPTYGGPYILVWDVKRSGGLASACMAAHTGETLRVPVMVQGGLCRQVDLTELCDVIAATSDYRRASGDFDGLGNSFPREMLPPDLSANSLALYQAGYYTPEDAGGPPAQKEICFRYPAERAGVQKAVTCQGQTIPLPAMTVSRVHILGAGTGAGISGSFVANFADGHTQAIPLEMSSWLEPPSHSETVGFVTPYLRNLREDNARQRGYLHHYVITLAQPGELTSLVLPYNEEMKVFAITLEGPARPESSPPQ